MFVVVGRVTDRVLKRKAGRLSPLVQRHSGAGKNPSGARGKLTPQGVRMDFHLDFVAHVVGVIVDYLLYVLLQREDFLKLDEVWSCS